MSKPNGRQITTGDFKTYYFEVGEGDPLILIHGGGAGADGWSNWASSLPYFSKRKRVIVVDMVGFGHSDKPDPSEFTYSQAARNRQLIDFIEAVGLSKVSLVGNSMGGATALGVAVERPDLVADLVLMGAAGLEGKMSPELATIMNYDFTLDGMRRIGEALTNPSYVMSDEQLKYRHQLSLDPDAQAAYTAIMGWVRENGFGYSPEQIRSVSTRTLVFHGKDDRVVPLTDAYKFLELLDNSTGYLMPDCGHWVMNEYPEIFSRIVVDFLDRYDLDQE